MDFFRRINMQKLIVPLSVLFGFYLLFRTLGVVVRNYELQQDFDQLAADIELLELQNEQLRLNNQYYETDEYLERAAREELGLVAPGEKVLILPDRGENPQVLSVEDQKPDGFVANIKHNFSQWMFFLFGREPS